MTARSDGDDDQERWYWDDRKLRFDEADGTYVLDRCPDRNPVVDAVLALAWIEGVDPLEMTPLYEELTPDVLPLVAATIERESAETEAVGFSAYGRTVRIGADELRIR